MIIVTGRDGHHPHLSESRYGYRGGTLPTWILITKLGGSQYLMEGWKITFPGSGEVDSWFDAPYAIIRERDSSHWIKLSRS